MEEEKEIKVTYTFYLPTHQNELNHLRYTENMATTLWNIDKECHDLIKYHEISKELDDFAEKIRDMVRESVPIDELII